MFVSNNFATESVDHLKIDALIAIHFYMITQQWCKDQRHVISNFAQAK